MITLLLLDFVKSATDRNITEMQLVPLEQRNLALILINTRWTFFQIVHFIVI